jgi:hypothetical protein
LVDPRTVNKFVQFDKRRLSQSDMFHMIEKFYPGRRFDTVHVTSEDIIHGSKHGSESTSSAAGGHEPDRERHGINFCCWVDDKGVFAPYDDNTLNAGASWVAVAACSVSSSMSQNAFAAELFPDYKWITVEELIR